MITYFLEHLPLIDEADNFHQGAAMWAKKRIHLPYWAKKFFSCAASIDVVYGETTYTRYEITPLDTFLHGAGTVFYQYFFLFHRFYFTP